MSTKIVWVGFIENGKSFIRDTGLFVSEDKSKDEIKIKAHIYEIGQTVAFPLSVSEIIFDPSVSTKVANKKYEYIDDGYLDGNGFKYLVKIRVDKENISVKISCEQRYKGKRIKVKFGEIYEFKHNDFEEKINLKYG